jgi:hypothetical protein
MSGEGNGKALPWALHHFTNLYNSDDRLFVSITLMRAFWAIFVVGSCTAWLGSAGDWLDITS